MDNQANFFRGMNLQWAGSRERNLASGRGGGSFLTSLFIELIDSPQLCKSKVPLCAGPFRCMELITNSWWSPSDPDLLALGLSWFRSCHRYGGSAPEWTF